MQHSTVLTESTAAASPQHRKQRTLHSQRSRRPAALQGSPLLRRSLPRCRQLASKTDGCALLTPRGCCAQPIDHAAGACCLAGCSAQRTTLSELRKRAQACRASQRTEQLRAEQKRHHPVKSPRVKCERAGRPANSRCAGGAKCQTGGQYQRQTCAGGLNACSMGFGAWVL